MTCEEAAEFVSALCDYETIPQAAAGHIGACASCQARLKEYIEIGVELRRVASLESLEEARPRAWEKTPGKFINLVAERMGDNENSEICICFIAHGNCRAEFRSYPGGSPRART